MTGEEIVKEQNAYLAKQGAPNWAGNELNEAKEMKITDGTTPMTYIPRYQAAIMAKRAAEVAIKACREEIDALRNEIAELKGIKG